MKIKSAQATVNYLLDRIGDDTVLGIGTGSTVNIFLDALAQHKQRLNCVVASSDASEALLAQLGIKTTLLSEVESIDFYIDGADYVDSEFRMIKGGGGALVREKVLASMASYFLCMVDESKLCKTFTDEEIPIEVLPFAESCVKWHLNKLNIQSSQRMNFLSDNNHVIYDLKNLPYSEGIDLLEIQLNQIPGVIDNGIFSLYRASRLFIGTHQGG